MDGRAHEASNARDVARAPTANVLVRYSKSLTVGVKKKKTIPLCHVAYELTSSLYNEKKWWAVIVTEGTVGIQSEGDLSYSGVALLHFVSLGYLLFETQTKCPMCTGKTPTQGAFGK